MSEHSHDISKHVRTYVIVFVALLVGTIVTVLMNSVHFDSMRVTIAIALFIAIIKAFLVAGYFMHLISERKMIYGILTATVFFFAGLMYLTVWSMETASFPTGTFHTTESHGDGATKPAPAHH